MYPYRSKKKRIRGEQAELDEVLPENLKREGRWDSAEQSCFGKDTKGSRLLEIYGRTWCGRTIRNLSGFFRNNEKELSD
jgi:hypothetical protein